MDNKNKENFLGSQKFFNLFLKAQKARASSRFKVIRAVETVNYSIFVYLFLLTFLFKASVVATVLGFIGGFVALLLHEVKHEGVLKESEDDMLRYMTKEKLQYFLQSYIHTQKDHNANIQNPKPYVALMATHKSQSVVFSQRFYHYLDSYFNKTSSKNGFHWTNWTNWIGFSKGKTQDLLKEYEFDKILAGQIPMPNGELEAEIHKFLTNSDLLEVSILNDNSSGLTHNAGGFNLSLQAFGKTLPEEINKATAQSLDISKNSDNSNKAPSRHKYLYQK